MRVVVLLIALAGCPSATSPSNGDDVGAGPNQECVEDSQCSAAGAKCCDCPTFAVPSNDPAFDACLGVACPMPQSACPSNIAPACRQGNCVLACVAMVCASSCADGFALDGDGCLSCDCAQVTTRQCTLDTDCARVPADCCGCALGGADTAVPAGDEAAHDASLDCPSNPSCPAVDSCAANLAPRCVEGACELISGDLSGTACGRQDLAACAPGEVCTVNYDEGATARGVGVCVPAT